MKCTEIHELLPDLAAGLASAPPGINDHLHSCTECAGKLEEFRKTMALLDEWQAPEPSPYFDTRLHARLREEAAQQQHSWFSWVRRPAMAASFALVLVAGITVYQVERSRGTKAPVQIANAVPSNTEPGTAVSDLQVLDKNQDLLADSDSDSASDLLDDLQVQQDVTANP
jgi:negative regulator of sigma E activity